MILAEWIDGCFEVGQYNERIRRAKRDQKSPVEIFCFEVLQKAEPAISFIIEELPDGVRIPICILHLIKNTISSIRNSSVVRKERMLAMIPDALYDLEFYFQYVDMGDLCGELTSHFDVLSSLFVKLDKGIQKILLDCVRQAIGNMVENPTTISDYNLACYQGEGIYHIAASKIYSETGCEPLLLENEVSLGNALGTLVMKVKLLDQPETWPQEVTQVYNMDLGNIYLKSHMVLDALRDVYPTLQYVDRLCNERIFRYAAMETVFAMNSLVMHYTGQKVDVKVERMYGKITNGFKTTMLNLVEDLFRLIKDSDPNSGQLRHELYRIRCKLLLYKTETIDNGLLTRGEMMEMFTISLILGIIVNLYNNLFTIW